MHPVTGIKGKGYVSNKDVNRPPFEDTFILAEGERILVARMEVDLELSGAGTWCVRDGEQLLPTLATDGEIARRGRLDGSRKAVLVLTPDHPGQGRAETKLEVDGRRLYVDGDEATEFCIALFNSVALLGGTAYAYAYGVE